MQNYIQSQQRMLRSEAIKASIVHCGVSVCSDRSQAHNKRLLEGLEKGQRLEAETRLQTVNGKRFRGGSSYDRSLEVVFFRETNK